MKHYILRELKKKIICQSVFDSFCFSYLVLAGLIGTAWKKPVRNKAYYFSSEAPALVII